MGRHSGQSDDEIYDGIALTELAIGGERRCLAHLATEQGLPKNRPASERFRKSHVATIKKMEKDVRELEAELLDRGR
jgi:hypothetical protein